ncbi:MAG: ATP-dependent DNA helicase RecG [SAR202 cluster bacterium]|nr:ATP-dependent DNA helicase RecG [SAR202 cluster bacterium]MQG79053.1 ATP-dependent DNA helicase RecG [SAR202 cluster bacterium]|tara:strand:+ start:3030 stop:5507 length:2478 start_codon:yes stop_codon:yes gene_type:complete
MATQETGAPSWAGAFQNILNIEESHGFDNKAVMGGLDKFLARWSEDMAAQAAGNEGFLLKESYDSMSAAVREDWVAQWREALGGPPNPNKPPKPNPAAQKKKTAAKKKPAYKAPPDEVTVDAPVNRLRGVDTKLTARLKRLDVETIRDLLYLFPRRHEDYSTAVKISELSPGEECTVVATIWEAREVAKGPKGGRRDTEAVLSDETGNLKVIWFGQRYLARSLKPGSQIAISGKASVFRGQLVFENPEHEMLDASGSGAHTGRLVPIYPLTEGLTRRNMRRLTWQTVQNWVGGLEDALPDDILARTELMPLLDAVYQAHYPKEMETWELARRRLAFDELFTLQLAVLARRRMQHDNIKGIEIIAPANVIDGFYQTLPFPLTKAQRRCIQEIEADFRAGTPPMSRLLQGEVGSGKTVVALSALLSAAAAGYQGAMMVPTEVLAEQHFQSIGNLLSGLARPVQEPHLLSVYLDHMDRPVSIGLLTGSSRAPVKRELTKMAADGTLDILVGTQALIQEGISLPRLALAVADEQHRFGVIQRSALQERGQDNPHTLIMSATPIPRTLSLTLFGDLDISTIDEMPAGRQEVATRRLEPEQRDTAYGFIRRQVEEGRQAFVVCPLVDESETIESKAATEEYQRLSQDIFPDLSLGLLHGRMPGKEKDKVMRQFRDGELDILVSTPVVEVGIDVANATVMMIDGADRFGLAQLHQFRGRVGRGEHKGYCILMSDTVSETAKERLSALARIQDGFKLAEVDLELRGPGDFFGTRQSGLPSLKMAHLTDLELLEMARNEATKLMEDDPDLKQPDHAGIAAQVARFVDQASANVA